MTNQTVVVKQVKQSLTFDVFTGQGWLNWSRVVWNTKTKRITLVKGERLAPNELKQVYEKVEQIFHNQVKEEV